MDPRFGHMTRTQQKHVERIARQISRGLGHNDDTGMDWDRYVAPAVIVINENPSLLRPDPQFAQPPRESRPHRGQGASGTFVAGVQVMEELFAVNCSSALARALGAQPMPRLDRPNLSFQVFDPPHTHHACLQTDAGPFAWLWQIDATHPSISKWPWP